MEILRFRSEDLLFFTADTHFGHKNIIEYCKRPFRDVEEMNETLIDNWNRTVGMNDIVFHLGDFGMGDAAEWNRILERLNGRIYLIAGNHDLRNLSSGGITRFEKVSMQLLIQVGKRRIYLNHYPFLCFSGSERDSWQLFGHVHSNSQQSTSDNSRLKYLMATQYDVGVDNNDYAPISYRRIRDIIIGRREQL